MIVRLVLGVGLFALGYYLGREVGRAEPVREALRSAREGEGTAPGATGEPPAAPGAGRGADVPGESG
ncbi:MAG: hypothetical protein MUC77_04255 [Chromatiaceae bacterium]|jgi:hypothetical protein|nr:hypothetical protein [Chromatiaceae bacterium]